MMCAVALERAAQLAERGMLPRRRLGRWRREAAAIREFVESQCWSEEKGAYVRFAGARELDASVLLGVMHRYADPRDPRLRSTLDPIADEAAYRPLLHP